MHINHKEFGDELVHLLGTRNLVLSQSSAVAVYSSLVLWQSSAIPVQPDILGSNYLRLQSAQTALQPSVTNETHDFTECLTTVV